MAADKEKLDFDVIIVGAGISGINFAYRLQERNPELKYCILEGRHEIGGTWSLFQYPGIRSDSDLFTFGFAWRPWVGNMSIVHGSIIRQYVEDSATQEGIDKKIRFLHQASIPGIDSFKGKVIHPQFWPSDLDYANKRIVIIGSGATAITLLPSLATNSAHVTMLQRSPTYIASLPREGKFEAIISRALPMFASSRIIRFKWILFSLFMVSICRRFPRTAKRLLLQRTAKLLPPGTNLEPDFVPSYNPWEQRLCLCPDGDFYSSIRSGKASVKTSKIEAITPHSIKLTSGEELNPDIIVTATGLKLCTAGNIAISVDGEEYDISHHFAWRAAMVEGLPNVVLSWGYSNASWTLGADSTAQLACRLLTRMKKEGFLVIVPRMTPEDRETLKERPFLALSATYVKIGGDAFPKTASTDPWRPRSYFWKDLAVARWGDIKRGMEWLR